MSFQHITSELVLPPPLDHYPSKRIPYMNGGRKMLKRQSTAQTHTDESSFPEIIMLPRFREELLILGSDADILRKLPTEAKKPKDMVINTITIESVLVHDVHLTIKVEDVNHHSVKHMSRYANQKTVIIRPRGSGAQKKYMHFTESFTLQEGDYVAIMGQSEYVLYKYVSEVSELIKGKNTYII